MLKKIGNINEGRMKMKMKFNLNLNFEICIDNVEHR